GAAGKRPTADTAAGRRRPLPVVRMALAVAADAIAAALLLWYPARTTAAVAAAALHLLSVVPLATARALAPSERALASALGFTLPVWGTPLAALTLGTPGRSELGMQPPDEAFPLEVPDPDEVGRLAEAVPSSEILLEGGTEERRA